MQRDVVSGAEVSEEIRTGNSGDLGEIDSLRKSAWEGEKCVSDPGHEIEDPADGACESIYHF